MNRLFIIVATLAGIAGGAWALRESAIAEGAAAEQVQSGEPDRVNAKPEGTEKGAVGTANEARPTGSAKDETRACCVKAPSRASFLTKPAEAAGR